VPHDYWGYRLSIKGADQGLDDPQGLDRLAHFHEAGFDSEIEHSDRRNEESQYATNPDKAD
jgi:hypothetical protein